MPFKIPSKNSATTSSACVTNKFSKPIQRIMNLSYIYFNFICAIILIHFPCFCPVLRIIYLVRVKGRSRLFTLSDLLKCQSMPGWDKLYFVKYLYQLLNMSITLWYNVLLLRPRTVPQLHEPQNTLYGRWLIWATERCFHTFVVQSVCYIFVYVASCTNVLASTIQLNT